MYDDYEYMEAEFNAMELQEYEQQQLLEQQQNEEETRTLN